jgi:hypothetical protein
MAYLVQFVAILLLFSFCLMFPVIYLMLIELAKQMVLKIFFLLLVKKVVSELQFHCFILIVRVSVPL